MLAKGHKILIKKTEKISVQFENKFRTCTEQYGD